MNVSIHFTVLRHRTEISYLLVLNFYEQRRMGCFA